jgi:hypothetical protein
MEPLHRKTRQPGYAMCGLVGAVLLLAGCDASNVAMQNHPARPLPKSKSEVAQVAPSIPDSEMGEDLPADPPRPRIYRLPPPDDEPTPPAPQQPRFEDIASPSDLTFAPTDPNTESAVASAVPAAEPPQAEAITPVREPAPKRAFTMEEYDEDAEAAAAATIDDLSAYMPTEGELSPHLRGDVQQAFTLARHGALHAARSRFVALLEQMARAKDAAHMTSEHTRALAAGLRALEEADDFAKVSADDKALEVARGAGHQTPMLQADSARWTLPHEAMGMYHRYAERKLAAAVKGEQAGSMALFGIGRIYQQLATRQDGVSQPLPKGLTYFRAAVLAHPQNHLAANEAGVLLARSGRYAQALPWLEHAARLASQSVTQRNLAYVCEKLGDAPRAAIHAGESQRLASLEMSHGQLSAERGIEWLSPDEFARRSGSAAAQGPPAGEPRVATAGPSEAPQTPLPNQQQAVPPEPKPTRAPSFWW